jgi:hypothetical protein
MPPITKVRAGADGSRKGKVLQRVAEMAIMLCDFILAPAGRSGYLFPRKRKPAMMNKPWYDGERRHLCFIIERSRETSLPRMRALVIEDTCIISWHL